MKVKYDGQEYDFDLDDVDVAQAKVIKSAFGLTLMGLEEGLSVGDPDALQAVFWLMLAQNGRQQDPNTVNFKIVKFAQAMNEAMELAEKEAKAAGRAEKKAQQRGAAASQH